MHADSIRIRRAQDAIDVNECGARLCRAPSHVAPRLGHAIAMRGANQQLESVDLTAARAGTLPQFPAEFRFFRR
jgi:hypothetical protein